MHYFTNMKRQKIHNKWWHLGLYMLPTIRSQILLIQKKKLKAQHETYTESRMTRRHCWVDQKHCDPSIRHNFRTSLVIEEPAVPTRTRRTRPSLSGKTSWTMAFGQLPRLDSSAINTRSPTTKLRRVFNHFWRLCKTGTYMHLHLNQNWSAKFWTSFQDFL